MILASSTLCNLLLEFSPSKEPIVDSGAIDLLCQLTHKYDPSLRLNGVWGLMVRITKTSPTTSSSDEITTEAIEIHDLQDTDFQDAQEIQIIQDNQDLNQIIEVDVNIFLIVFSIYQSLKMYNQLGILIVSFCFFFRTWPFNRIKELKSKSSQR